MQSKNHHRSAAFSSLPTAQDLEPLKELLMADSEQDFEGRRLQAGAILAGFIRNPSLKLMNTIKTGS